MKSELEASQNATNDKKAIVVIGSGDFGRALALRMVKNGFKVYIGSRNPERHRNLVENFGASIVKIDEALKHSNLVVLAIPKEFYVKLDSHLFESKTVIDVSNRSSVQRKEEMSQAEHLQSLLPKASIVKAFNVLSAYALESGGIQGTKEVPYAGDDVSSKQEVINLIRQLGFTPVDCGSLQNSREIEDIPVQRFGEWKKPFIVSFALFLFFFLLAFVKHEICRPFERDGKWSWKNWESIPIEQLNTILAVHSLNLLALCYLPGCIAGWIQIGRGTKYSRFPNWLDQWLKMRKQLGLFMLLSASIHACQSLALLPSHHTQEGQMGIKIEIFLCSGIIALGIAIILGITSLPSVTKALTWKEFAFVQSKLGWFCLLLGWAHDFAHGWPRIWFGDKDYHASCWGTVPPSGNYALYIPSLTIAMKIILLIPPVDWYLTKIRGGWERGRSKYENNTQSDA